MPTAREQASLNEAARLLQEGLDLLAERSLEVNALLEDARERALDITTEAEQRAAQIVADAETRRTELDEQIAALQSEVASLREELVQLRTTRQGKGGRFLPAAAPAVVAATPSEVASEPQRVELSPPAPETAPPEVAPEDAPHWGRRSDTPPTTRSRSRPRWLPPWLPFLLVLLVGGLALANMAGGEALLGPAGAQPTAQDALLPTPSTNATFLRSGSGTTALATQPLASAPLLAQTPVSPTPALSATHPPTRAPTATRVPLALVVPTATFGPSPTVRATVIVPRAPVVAPLSSRPGEASRDGTLVAVYTSYVTYIVQRGDTLNRLATQFGVSGDAIVRASGLNDPNLLVPGQVLTIPRESGWLYRVQPNETLEDIAGRFGTSVDDLLASSMLSSATVRPGELLFIPSRALPKGSD